MSDSPRWERESHEDLSAPVPPPSDTAEMRALAAPLVAPGELSEPPEYRHNPGREAEEENPAREASGRWRLLLARESLADARAGAHDRLLAACASTRERVATTRVSLSDAGGSLAESSRRVGRFIAALDRRPEREADGGRDPVAELTMAVGGGDQPGEEAGRFPVAARGYDRDAVDAHLAELESELARLRARAEVPLSISEEIERLGEQTASILITAHDTAHETARRAQEQAARAVSTAAGDAERITSEARQRLDELDAATDAVWRERERLLADVREVSATLATLADSASERFPGETDPAQSPVGTAAE